MFISIISEHMPSFIYSSNTYGHSPWSRHCGLWIYNDKRGTAFSQRSRVGMEPKIIKLQMSISDDDDDEYNYELCLQYTIINFKNGNNVHYQEILQGQREKLVEHEKRWRP